MKEDKDIQNLIKQEQKARASGNYSAASRLRGILKRNGVSFRGDQADYHETRRTPPPNYRPNGPN